VEWCDSFRIDREWFQPRGRYTLALVRSDLFAMGSYDGDERVGFHGFDSALKSQHSKGGFSQSRFERLRDEQIDSHLDRCRAALDERDADRLYLVGERTVLDDLAELADETAAVDATGDPEEALADAAEEFWSVQLRTL
jgi:peptide subunit release factor 1 (eRF1)